MSFLDTLAQMMVILFAIVCGYAANRMGILGGTTDQKISRLLLTVTVPAMILASVSTGDTLPDTGVVLGTLGAGFWFYAVEFLFILTVPHLLGGTAGQKGVWRYTLAFPNVAFIGYPVVLALYGQQALFYAVILCLPFNLLSFTLGPLLLTGAGRFSPRQLLSPRFWPRFWPWRWLWPGCGFRRWQGRCWPLWETSPCRCLCCLWALCWRDCPWGGCCSPPGCGCSR